STYRLPPGVLVSGQNTLAIFSATGHWVPAQGSPPVVVEKSYRQWTGVSVEPVEMFSCRFCSESPFARLFGEDPPPQASTPQGVQGRDSGGTAGRQTRRSPSSFVRRSPEEMKRLIASWDHYVSSRARDFFVTRERLEDV
ncbi:Beta-galactosidase 6, variant 2, partial [Perkinsus olseni]